MARRHASVLVGTSGWQYRHWRDVLYDRDLPQRLWLERYAEVYSTVEVNNTFYRLPKRDTFSDWRERVPPRFVFTIKASRYLTHIKRLRDPDQPVQTLMERASALGSRLGPILLQLPPDMQCDPQRLRATLSCFPKGQRVAVEVRHGSWLTDEVRALMAEHNAPLALTNRLGRWLEPSWHTADWAYMRLHSGRARGGGYGDVSLRSTAKLVGEIAAERADVFVYFNNDGGGHAVHNALALRDMLDRSSSLRVA